MPHNNYFQFKQFRVDQNHAAMRVGTDGALLGAWANVQNATRILDIGTGTGVIALMLAQRSNASIDAIDIEAGAMVDAVHNFEHSPWKERLHGHHTSLQEYVEKTRHKYDCIVSNPPFFNNSIQSLNKEKATARHSGKLSFVDLITGAANLLNQTGKFCVIIPSEFEKEFQMYATHSGLFLTKITKVKPNYKKACKRVLLQFEFFQKVIDEDELIVETETRHHHTEEFIRLMKPFYLKL